jgi:ferritin
MNTTPISIAEALNDQMTKEAHASQIYLSYGSWADSQGFAVHFLFVDMQTKNANHMMKILAYILKRGESI